MEINQSQPIRILLKKSVPVTPSVSETAAKQAEEEEDAKNACAVTEEERQQKRAELETEIANNEDDTAQVNEEIGWYNRDYLYNVRDLEKLFAVTPCPLTSEELKNFGVCRSLVGNEIENKQDGQRGFMPAWARSGRQLEQNNRGGGRPGSNKTLPLSTQPSTADTNGQLKKAWTTDKVTETDESDETKKKRVLNSIRSLLNKISPATKEALINEFLDHKVFEWPSLPEVVSIIFDKAIEQPESCTLYASLCQIQVKEELNLNNNVSNFRNEILVRGQETFMRRNLEDIVKVKEAEIDAETDKNKKNEKKIELLEIQNNFRRRKFGRIIFIGHLYMQNLISGRIIHFCVVDLLKTVTEKPENTEEYEADEDSIECALHLLETIGKQLQDQANAASLAAAVVQNPAPKVILRGSNPTPAAQPQPPKHTFPLDMTFQTLEGAIPIVSNKLQEMIMNLSELRKNNWVPRKNADA